MGLEQVTAKGTQSRRERYLAILEQVTGQVAFELAEIQQLCSSERPGFVTRVINQLEGSGWLVRESSGSGNTKLASCYFRWSHRKPEFEIDRWLRETIDTGQIREKPADERPRERLLRNGASSLRNSDLLAILIRSGQPGYSAMEAGEDLVKAYEGRLERLSDASPRELKATCRAVAKTAYCQIMAGIELGRRIAELGMNAEIPSRITSSSDAISFCRSHFRRLISDSAREEFHIVCLDTKNQFIDSHQVSVGTLDASLVHPREVFRPAIKDSASSVLLVHNHPSGDPQPSSEDFQVTVRLESAGELIGIDVLDHIVLGSSGCASIREERN